MKVFSIFYISLTLNHLIDSSSQSKPQDRKKDKALKERLMSTSESFDEIAKHCSDGSSPFLNISQLKFVVNNVDAPESVKARMDNIITMLGSFPRDVSIDDRESLRKHSNTIRTIRNSIIVLPKKFQGPFLSLNPLLEYKQSILSEVIEQGDKNGETAASNSNDAQLKSQINSSSIESGTSSSGSIKRQGGQKNKKFNKSKLGEH